MSSRSSAERLRLHASGKIGVDEPAAELGDLNLVCPVHPFQGNDVTGIQARLGFAEVIAARGASGADQGNSQRHEHAPARRVRHHAHAAFAFHDAFQRVTCHGG